MRRLPYGSNTKKASREVYTLEGMEHKKSSAALMTLLLCLILLLVPVLS